MCFWLDRTQLGYENLFIEKSKKLRQSDPDWICIYIDNNAILKHFTLNNIDFASYKHPNYGQNDVAVLALNRENYDFS